MIGERGFYAKFLGEFKWPLNQHRFFSLLGVIPFLRRRLFYFTLWFLFKKSIAKFRHTFRWSQLSGTAADSSVCHVKLPFLCTWSSCSWWVMVPPPSLYFCIFWVSIPSCDNLKMPFSKNMVAFLRQLWFQTFGPNVLFSYCLRADWGFLNQNILLWYAFKIFSLYLGFSQIMHESLLWDRDVPWPRSLDSLSCMFSAERSLGLCPRQMAERAMCEAGKVHPVSSMSQNCALLLSSTFELLFLSLNQPACLKLWIISLSSKDWWELCILYPL